MGTRLIIPGADFSNVSVNYQLEPVTVFDVNQSLDLWATYWTNMKEIPTRYGVSYACYKDSADKITATGIIIAGHGEISLCYSTITKEQQNEHKDDFTWQPEAMGKWDLKENLNPTELEYLKFPTGQLVLDQVNILCLYPENWKYYQENSGEYIPIKYRGGNTDESNIGNVIVLSGEVNSLGDINHSVLCGLF